MANHRKHPKIDPVYLNELYWGQFLSTPKIAKITGVGVRSILEQMKIAGIQTRRHTQIMICKIPGCGKPAHKIEHKLCRSGSFGTLCKAHRTEHRSKLSKIYQRKIKQIDPAKYHWWQEKYSNDERIKPWKEIQLAKQSLRSLRRCVADLEAGRLQRQESLQEMTSPC